MKPDSTGAPRDASSEEEESQEFLDSLWIVYNTYNRIKDSETWL